jgi:hypothetical protein
MNKYFVIQKRKLEWEGNVKGKGAGGEGRLFCKK